VFFYFATFLQREKELLKAVEYHKKQFERALNKCVEEENRLDHQEEQSNQAQKQVFFFMMSAFKDLNMTNYT